MFDTASVLVFVILEVDVLLQQSLTTVPQTLSQMPQVFVLATTDVPERDDS